MSWISTLGPSKTEKLIGLGKKNVEITSRGTVFRADKKKKVSGTGDASQELCLSTFEKNLQLRKQGIINNLRAESS